MLHFHRSVAHVTFLYDRFFFCFYFSHSLFLLLSPCAVCVNVLICILSRFAVCFLPYYCQQEQQQQKQRTTKRAAIELCKKSINLGGGPLGPIVAGPISKPPVCCWTGIPLEMHWQELTYICRLGAVTGSERSD